MLVLHLWEGKIKVGCIGTPRYHCSYLLHEALTIFSLVLFSPKFSLLMTVFCLGLFQLPGEQLNVSQDMVQHLLNPQQPMAMSGQL